MIRRLARRWADQRLTRINTRVEQLCAKLLGSCITANATIRRLTGERDQAKTDYARERQNRHNAEKTAQTLREIDRDIHLKRIDCLEHDATTLRGDNRHLRTRIEDLHHGRRLAHAHYQRCPQWQAVEDDGEAKRYFDGLGDR